MPLIWNAASACQPLSDRCLGRCQEKQPHNGNKEITQQPLAIKTRVKGMQSRIQSGKQLEGQGQQSPTCAAGGRRDLGAACEQPCWFGGGRWPHCLPLLFKLPAGFPCWSCPTESSSKCHFVGVCKRIKVAPVQQPMEGVSADRDESRQPRVSSHAEPV